MVSKNILLEDLNPFHGAPTLPLVQFDSDQDRQNVGFPLDPNPLRFW